MASKIDTLMTCAELALVLAGFSGIIVVLSRSGTRWDPHDRLRVTGLLVVAFGSLVFALAPARACWVAAVIRTGVRFESSDTSLSTVIARAICSVSANALAT